MNFLLLNREGKYWRDFINFLKRELKKLKNLSDERQISFVNCCVGEIYLKPWNALLLCVMKNKIRILSQ